MILEPVTSRADAARLDQQDPLSAKRSSFDLPDGVIYLVGHSLGPAPKSALAAIDETATAAWAKGLVKSWNTAGWIDLPRTVGAKISRLIGAAPDEVVVCDSVTLNLYKILHAVLPHVRTRAIAVHADEFPTDRFIAEEVAQQLGASFTLYADEDTPDPAAIIVQSAVSFRKSQLANIEREETRACEAGGAVIWDLSHASGVVPVDIARANYAVGCSYKYLNGGPGAPAFIYVRKELHSQLRTPLPGWLGHADPFAFAPEYVPAPDLGRFVTGTPGILSLAALNGALEIFDDVSPVDFAAKARRLGEICIERAASMGLATTSPHDAALRGGHVSLVHEEGYGIAQALAERGVMVDFRTPDTVRFGFSPLFLRYVDVWDAMDHLHVVLRDKLWDRPDYRHRSKVT